MGHGEVFLRDILAVVRKGLARFRGRRWIKMNLLCMNQHTLQQ